MVVNRVAATGGSVRAALSPNVGTNPDVFVQIPAVVETVRVHVLRHINHPALRRIRHRRLREVASLLGNLRRKRSRVLMMMLPRTLRRRPKTGPSKRRFLSTPKCCKQVQQVSLPVSHLPNSVQIARGTVRITSSVKSAS